MNSTGNIIKTIRKKNKLTQIQLAEKLGTNNVNICNYERGFSICPSDRFLTILSMCESDADLIRFIRGEKTQIADLNEQPACCET